MGNHSLPEQKTCVWFWKLLSHRINEINGISLNSSIIVPHGLITHLWAESGIQELLVMLLNLWFYLIYQWFMQHYIYALCNIIIYKSVLFICTKIKMSTSDTYIIWVVQYGKSLWFFKEFLPLVISGQSWHWEHNRFSILLLDIL